jgi:bisphosphoglycerate-independent phosphoglycerate mutase (AlkP superfamily)
MLWIKSPRGMHKVHSEKVSLCDIAPTVLSTLGLPSPPEMRGNVLVESSRVAV